MINIVTLLQQLLKQLRRLRRAVLHTFLAALVLIATSVLVTLPSPRCQPVGKTTRRE